MTRYVNCFNCAVETAACPRRAEIRRALSGTHIYSVKFKCDSRQPMFSAGQRVVFHWTWWDDGDGYPVEFHATVLREVGSKFVVQVDRGQSSSDDGVMSEDVFRKNDQLLIKVRPSHMRALEEPPRRTCQTCYYVEGVAEDRCYASGYYSPVVCARSKSEDRP